MAIDEAEVKELLRVKGNYLYHREGQQLEFKEQFSFAGLAAYFRDFAAFANNRGGYLIFGVKDSPRIPIGLNDSSIDQFVRIDPEKISGFLLDIFSSDVRWDQAVVEAHGGEFGAFYIYEAATKPVISKKDRGGDQEIRNGDIYYRYGGRTQRIRHAELEGIIASRVEEINQRWRSLVQRIGRVGPDNAVILDTERSIVEKEDAQVLVLDEDLADRLRFIKSGEFTEEEGEKTLKLVGDVVPLERVEVVKKVKEDRLRRYPFSAMELAREIERTLSYVKRHKIWQAIKENGLKENPNYSVYNFRNKKQQDEYEATGCVPPSTPSIYNHSALEFLLSVLAEDERSS